MEDICSVVKHGGHITSPNTMSEEKKKDFLCRAEENISKMNLQRSRTNSRAITTVTVGVESFSQQFYTAFTLLLGPLLASQGINIEISRIFATNPYFASDVGVDLIAHSGEELSNWAGGFEPLLPLAEKLGILFDGCSIMLALIFVRKILASVI